MMAVSDGIADSWEPSCGAGKAAVDVGTSVEPQQALKAVETEETKFDSKPESEEGGSESEECGR